MAGSRPSFQKRQKEQKRREKQLAKQDRKAQRKAEKPAGEEFSNPVAPPQPNEDPFARNFAD